MIASCSGRMPGRWYWNQMKGIRWVANGKARPSNRVRHEQRPRRIQSDKR